MSDVDVIEDPPIWSRRRVQIIAAALLALIVAGWCWSRRGAAADETAQPIVSVKLAKAEIGPIAQPLDLVGTISARQEATLSPKVSAQIAQMGLLKNRVVHRGDVLAVLESRDLTAQQAEAAAALREAEIGITNTSSGAIPLTNAQDVKAVHDAQGTLDNARKTYERRKTLFEQGGISKKDLEASQLDVTKAEDDLRLAEKSASLHQGTTNPSDLAAARSKAQQAAGHLAALQAQAGYATIRAPFDGVVGDQFLFQGDFATAGTKMLTIADTSTVIVKAPLSVDASMHVHAGDVATIQPDSLPGVTLQGTVSLVGSAADPQSRSVELWIALPNADGRLRPNSAARVTVNSGGVANAVVVPTAAVTLDATNANAGTVMVVDDKSVAHEVKVTTGAHSRERTQIISGLHGGETVVVEGNYGLPDGTKVQNADAVPKPAPAEKD
ncbi:MAG TPA: efflux RND transporter periplasmic adaptor subunit [Thermoanaerobaculia bacterium]|jgi:RND family efflux transporter MFP subunit|nr:efflux RND transporter periplasmic adaptor subunit [Thermoanaerobaculia bacterium]